MKAINRTAEVKGTRICFFDLFPSHFQFSKSTIHKLSERAPVILLIFDKNHPAYKSRPKNVDVFLIDIRWKDFFLKFLRIPYLVTPASHLHPSAVRPDLKTVHSYHSLVSMHAVYGDDAFDTYTHFFACGPHHVKEINKIKKARGLPPALVFDVGYPKLDDLASRFLLKVKDATLKKRKKVLLAPSWHENNLLKLHAKQICEDILNVGLDLVIRPHPHLFERDVKTMNLLRNIEKAFPGRISIENPNLEFDSFFNTDLMISDWSGVSFEYAFSTGRPVVFIDAPRKVNSEELLKLNLNAVEDSLRSSIGVIAPSVNDLSENIVLVLSISDEEWKYRISNIRNKNIFNFMNAAQVGADILYDISISEEMLSESNIPREKLREFINYYS